MPTIKRLEKKKRDYSTKNAQGAEYYASSAWHRLRKAYFMMNPICELCLQENKVSETQEIHHIKPFLNGRDEIERWELLLSQDNLMALCKTHHHKIHNDRSYDF